MKLDIAQLGAYLQTQVPRNRRFSRQSAAELQEVWELLHAYLEERLLHGKSVHVPGLGFFTILKNKREPQFSTPQFVAAAAWDAIPGLKLNRSISKVTDAAEPINYSAISQGTKYTRDVVEAVLKDLVHGMQVNLKLKEELALTCGRLGRLTLTQTQVQFKFQPAFVVAFQERYQPAQEAVTAGSPVPLDAAAPVPEAGVPGPVLAVAAAATAATATTLPVVGLSAPSTAAPSIAKYAILPTISVDHTAALDESGAAAIAALFSPTTRLNEMETAYDQEQKERAIQFLTTRNQEHHVHVSSGNRMWSNTGCSICRAQRLPSLGTRVQVAQKERDKYQDRLLLYLNIEQERQKLAAEQAEEEAKAELARKDAETNYHLALERSEQQRLDQVKEPMGNLFALRRAQPDRAAEGKLLGDSLMRQIHDRQQQERALHTLEAQENHLLSLNFAFDKQLTKAEEFVESSSRKQQQLDALKLQFQEKEEAKQAEALDKAQEPILYKENPFARSEKLLEMYQKQKAKQLYQEQLAIVEQKKEYERKILALEKGLAQERLAFTKKSLEKELTIGRNAAYTGRKSLELYWTEQMKLRKQLSSLEV